MLEIPIVVKKDESPIKQVEKSRKGFVTNYPPFAHWRQDAVSDMLADKPLNIYLHSPYCIQRCSYCFYKTVTLKESQLSEIDHYVDSLCREIELGVERFNLQGRPVLSMYFGGGTPTLLRDHHMEKIFKTLSENLSMNSPEITMEAEPVSLHQKKADMLEKFGVSRINMGVQSFKDEIVALTGRKDTDDKMGKAIEIAKNTGALVNIDLISGLAGENDESWAYTIDRTLDLGVESITIYKLELYANTEYFNGLRKKTLDLPSDGEEMRFMSYALEKMEEANYLPLNWYTFTRDGKYDHLHNRSIWGGDDLFCVGVSSFGRLGDFLYQNTNEIPSYTNSIDRNIMPINRSYHLSSLDKMIRDVLLGIKLVHFDLAKFEKRHGMRLEMLCQTLFSELMAEDFISITDDVLSLTRNGMLYGDYVGKRFAAELQALKQV